MPARAQRRDAIVLKNELKLNLVRTSHYPQSRHFLDACDDLGFLVLEEIPGWQHIGEDDWQDLAVRNVADMIKRDWNHPSIILWGVRINESQDNHNFYTRTNKTAHELDPSRQTGGIRYLYNSELLEDVFTMNDFGFPLREPNHPLYLNTEFNGHMFSTKRFDQMERVAEHTLRHARVHDQLASDDALCRRHWLVRFRLQHARQFRLGRPHLLSRRVGYFPHSESRCRFLQIAVRAQPKKWCWNLASTGRAAITPQPAAQALCRFAQIANI